MKAENETATRNERREQKIDYRNLRSTALNKSANLEQVKLTEKVQELKKPASLNHVGGFVINKKFHQHVW